MVKLNPLQKKLPYRKKIQALLWLKENNEFKLRLKITIDKTKQS